MLPTKNGYSLSAKLIFRPDQSHCVALLDGESFPINDPTELALLKTIASGHSNPAPNTASASLVQKGILAIQPTPVPTAGHAKIVYVGVPPSALDYKNTASKPNLQILCTDDYLRPEILASLHAVIPTLLVRPLGKLHLIGPLLTPGQPICWACLANWLRIRRWRQASFTNWTGGAFPPDNPAPATHASRVVCRGLLLSLIDRFNNDGNLPDLHESILAFDPGSVAVSRIRLIPNSACPQCGPAKQAPAAERLQAFANPITGLAETIHLAICQSSAMHLAVARIYAPFPNDPRLGLIPPFSACGRGRTRTQAMNILMLEAAERHSLIFDGSELLAQCAIANAPFPLDDLLQVSPRQCVNEFSHWKRLAQDEAVSCAKAVSLMARTEVLIPAAAAYMNFRGSKDPDYYDADSNGCAAGYSLEQAIRHALLELIERDALAIWWYNQIPRPAIDPASLTDPGSGAALTTMRAAGRTLHLVDLTNDIGIPVLAAISAGADGRDIYLGSAADLGPASAARRAIGELLQFWFWDQRGAAAPSRTQWLAEASLSEFPFLNPTPSLDNIRHSQPPDQGQLTFILDQLKNVGLEAFAIDLTRPALGVPVARVIVPRLRTHRRRLGPGRLYDVPVALGWLTKPTEESRMNPFEPPL